MRWVSPLRINNLNSIRDKWVIGFTCCVILIGCIGFKFNCVCIYYNCMPLAFKYCDDVVCQKHLYTTLTHLPALVYLSIIGNVFFSLYTWNFELVYQTITAAFDEQKLSDFEFLFKITATAALVFFLIFLGVMIIAIFFDCSDRNGYFGKIFCFVGFPLFCAIIIPTLRVFMTLTVRAYKAM